jgi:hypothetical protein
MTMAEQFVIWMIWAMTTIGGFFGIRAAIRRRRNVRKGQGPLT